MSMLVTVFGGSGFLGRYVTRRLAKMGFRVRVAVRDPDVAHFVRMYGHVGQVVPVFCNIRDDASVRAALAGADAAVTCVGTFDAKGRNSFQAIHVDGATRIARICLEQGVRRLVHVSAIGAAEHAGSEYGRSKFAGEQGVLRHMPHAVILRPSVMFGHEDSFFNRFAAMAARSPVLPVVGADTLFQPVWVDDVAQVAAGAAAGQVPSGVHELGGPDVLTFRELMQRMLGVIRRRRLILNLPFWLGDLMGSGFALGRTLSGGLVKGPITRDQVAALRSHNVAAQGAPGFEGLGIAPMGLDTILPEYLWRFRSGGQYAALQDSARNLRT